jgi:signal transduction histidine kinase
VTAQARVFGLVAGRSLIRVRSTAGSVDSLNPMYGRIGLAALAGFITVGLFTAPPGALTRALVGAALAVAAGVPLFLWRTRAPLAWAAVATVGLVLIANGDPGSLGWFGACVLGGWCVLVAGPAVGAAYWAGALVLFAGEWVLADHDPGWGAWSAGVSFTIGAALMVRHQLTLVEQMRGLQADLAQRSRAEERNRIARDLHDVIAHSLTVSLLHVSSARLAVTHEPADAARALADAERLTRQSLADVRATVGLLRAPGDSGVAAPTPGMADLPQLVEDWRAAQAEISLTVEGDTTALPATTGATLYRIVQEALTNAARHAPGRPTHVAVRVHDEGVDLSVDSAGTPGTGTGMGLLNMKARAEAVGGTCDAGPGGDGWRVQASLPTAS